MRTLLIRTAVMFAAGMVATAEETQARDATQVQAEGCIEPGGSETGCLCSHGGPVRDDVSRD